MKFLKFILDFYIQSSIHVALAVYALVRMTLHMFHLPYDEPVAYFAFYGTIVGYNFVKYDALARTQKLQMSLKIKLYAVVSFLSFLAATYYFFQLRISAQVLSVSCLFLTLLYTLSFFPNKKNARNWAGLKIYIVSFCWVGVTLILPIINADILLTSDFYIKCIQRFLLVFVLILVFEIIDLSKDDPHLKTVPQKIGVDNTKMLGMLLLLPFYFLEFAKSNFESLQLFVNLLLVLMIAAFLYFANQNRSKYYSTFWVESIPIFWWLMIIFLQ